MLLLRIQNEAKVTVWSILKLSFFIDRAVPLKFNLERQMMLSNGENKDGKKLQRAVLLNLDHCRMAYGYLTDWEELPWAKRSLSAH